MYWLAPETYSVYAQVHKFLWLERFFYLCIINISNKENQAITFSYLFSLFTGKWKLFQMNGHCISHATEYITYVKVSQTQKEFMRTYIFQNSNKNIVKDFCPESCFSFLGASWRLPYLWCYLLSPQEAPRKLQKISRQKFL